MNAFGITLSLSLSLCFRFWVQELQFNLSSYFFCLAMNRSMNHPVICQAYKAWKSGGIFYGDSPFDFSTALLFFQVSLAASLTAFLQFVLTPLGESAFVSQMLAGIALGPSIIGKDSTFTKTVFPTRSFYINQTFSFFGCMLFMFLVGVKMDLSLVTNSGKKSLSIALFSISVPLIMCTGLALILQRTVTMEPALQKSLFTIAVFQSTNSFYVVACLLADLKLLNSELGRLALSSSLISGSISWIGLIVFFTIRLSIVGKDNSLTWMVLCLCFLVFLIIFILRPIMLWMISRTAREKAIKEVYIFAIFLMILICSLFGEYIGQHFMLGPMILGLAVPDGPPLGTALVDKLDTFVSSVLLPTYFVFSGSGINVFLIQMKTLGIMELMVFVAFVGKVLGTMVPSLYCKMPVVDALCLGLIMSTQGITDILMWQHGSLLFLIDQQSYSIMVMSTVVLTGTISPLVKMLYNPSNRYKSKRRRTIEHALPNAELRLLTCIYNQYNTPSIINLLDLSNPSLKSPICFYFVHLIELSGRSTPLLISHKPGSKFSARSHLSDHIINAFQLFEQNNDGKVLMNAYTAIAPCASMHDDICTLALEKRTSMVIIPFHKQWTTNTNDFQELTGPMIRSVNLNVLEQAPCSVGILVDRGTLSGTVSQYGEAFYDIGMIFIQGPDDREALAYAMRMAENPNVSLTVVRLLDVSKARRSSSADQEMDVQMMNKYKIFRAGKKRHAYLQEAVENSVEMINVIRSLDICYDLILVGRRHDNESRLFMGTDWNVENPELGFIGDMLISSDTNCDVSVLAVQQQTFGRMTESSMYVVMEQVCTVDIPRELGKVWPV